MDNTEQQIANFIVINVRSLEAGFLAKVSFNEKGGVIGSALGNDWHLEDRSQSIKPTHCEITYIDDSFCIKDLSGETYMNSSSMPLGMNKLARLKNDDEITIGEYQVRFFSGVESEVKESAHSLERYFSNDSNSLINGSSVLSVDTENVYEAEDDVLAELDPMVMLDYKSNSEKSTSLIDDPTDLKTSDQDFIDSTYDMVVDSTAKYTAEPDNSNDIKSNFSLNSIKRTSHTLGKGGATKKLKSFISKSIFNTGKLEKKTNENELMEADEMDDNVLDLLEQEVAKSYTKEDVKSSTSLNETHQFESKHVLGGSLISGLEVSIGDNASVEEMQKLSTEIGNTLRVCVQGLLDLHSQVKDSRYGMMHRSLQPIEDNPLKLGLSYEDTIRTMFDKSKSSVHLSAPSSVEESLRMIKSHNEAVQYATNIALGQILNALSPDALLKRFSRYNRDDNNGQDDKSWAWGMYENYYEELTSNRQKGFEKLFWEIFEQSYDKKLREKHAE